MIATRCVTVNRRTSREISAGDFWPLVHCVVQTSLQPFTRPIELPSSSLRVALRPQLTWTVAMD